MTASQYSRLKDIIRDIEAAARHPSPNVQAAYATRTADEWNVAVARIERALTEDDGNCAYSIISKWHDHGIVGVAAFCLPPDGSTFKAVAKSITENGNVPF